jgi:glycyl-tRNA synthetase beta chain
VTSGTEDFILELGTEELPPQSLFKLANAFHDLLLQQIDDFGIGHQESRYFATPRRLAVSIAQLAVSQQNKTAERQGPSISAAYDKNGKPTPAAIGFAKSCGVSVDQLQQQESAKGSRLCYKTEEQGKLIQDLLPGIVQTALGKLPVARAMRWGAHSYNFIRPVKWLLMMHGVKTIPCNLYGCQSGNVTRGHRFLSSGEIVLSSAGGYLKLLEDNYVIADIIRRKKIISEQVAVLAEKLNGQAVIDPDLLDEVAALVEWPIALAGGFDEGFLSVPQEALISTMAKNQKYFHLINSEQQLIAKFIAVVNIESTNPEVVIKGNEKVIRPRLADAKFFFDQDCKRSLSSLTPKLKAIIFQKELGSLFDKTVRIKAIASSIAKMLAIESVHIERAAMLCKSDLVTDMVGEFPSLQGIMGRYYAANDGEDGEVSSAMDEIYMPRFAGDCLPSSAPGICLALADRLDTLVGIFAIGQAPTGSKDPFALRRAALGVLRILIEKKLPLDLAKLIDLTSNNFMSIDADNNHKNELLIFFIARLKAMYLEQGVTSQIFQSVEALSIFSPVDFNSRIVAAQEFSKLPEASSLAEANKRVANILSKNSNEQNDDQIDPQLLTEPEEKALAKIIQEIAPKVDALCHDKNYSGAFALLVQLKPALDTFFDSVIVMDDNLDLRQNRLSILRQLRNLFLSVADISCLQK